MTSAEPTQSADTPADNALSAALANEHAVVYGYGVVSARCAPDVNTLVSAALGQHRERRDRAISMLAGRKVAAPVAAAGYQLPMPVITPADAERLAVRMENDSEVAWRAFVEQAQNNDDRAFGVAALTQSAVLAARWKQQLGQWPITTALPGAD